MLGFEALNPLLYGPLSSVSVSLFSGTPAATALGISTSIDGSDHLNHCSLPRSEEELSRILQKSLLRSYQQNMTQLHAKQRGLPYFFVYIRIFS
jgi:hypothetical protein